jgi:hypothetical protein
MVKQMKRESVRSTINRLNKPLYTHQYTPKHAHAMAAPDYTKRKTQKYMKKASNSALGEIF